MFIDHLVKFFRFRLLINLSKRLERVYSRSIHTFIVMAWVEFCAVIISLVIGDKRFLSQEHLSGQIIFIFIYLYVLNLAIYVMFKIEGFRIAVRKVTRTIVTYSVPMITFKSRYQSLSNVSTDSFVDNRNCLVNFPMF